MRLNALAGIVIESQRDLTTHRRFSRALRVNAGGGSLVVIHGTVETGKLQMCFANAHCLSRVPILIDLVGDVRRERAPEAERESLSLPAFPAPRPARPVNPSTRDFQVPSITC